MNLDELARATAAMDAPTFASHHPEPALLFLAARANAPGTKIDTIFGITRADLAATDDCVDEGAPTKASGISASSVDAQQAGASPVLFLSKTGRNPFENMVTVGRASNNDVVLAFPTVTKFHASFASSPSGWTITDQRSTNGTTVDGRRLAPGESTRVAEGTVLGFGPDVSMKLFFPSGLFGVLALFRSGIGLGLGPPPSP